MAVSFVRQLGNEPGVQLNPLRDNSDIPAPDNSDQMFGIIMRASRGRIDKPFLVTRSDVTTKLGAGEQVRVSALNEAWLHVVEALNNGAYAAVVQRLTTENAKIKYAVVTNEEGEFTYEVKDELPQDKYFLAVKHLECFNDGIKLDIHADENRQGGNNEPNNVITLRILDSADVVVFEATGSLDPEAKDDYGSSLYLPDVVASLTDTVEVTCGDKTAVVPPTSNAYGFNDSGAMQRDKSGLLKCFVEGEGEYQTADYARAREALQYSPYNYAYISSGGSRSPALLGQLAQLAFDTNRQLVFDVPGDLNPEAAVAFLEQLNLSSNKTAHLIQAYWSPLSADDPTGVNPKGIFGVATLNIAFRCARNAQRNAKGFAPKNYPVAGKNFPINRTRITQNYTCKNPELSMLAAAKINPVKYDVFTGAGLYVFSDSLTCAPVNNSLKKLIAVADMSADIDDQVTRTCKDNLQLPMQVAVKRTRDFLQTLFEGAEASGWLVPSADPAMNGAAFRFEVKPNEARPYDTMDVSYWVRYDGTVRQIYVTQTITR